MNEAECLRRKVDIGRQFAAQRRLCAATSRKKLWHAAKLLYCQNAESCRGTAQQLIGWRAGMVIIYAATILTSALLWEIVVGYNFALLAIGLLVTGGIVVLHFLPGDRVLARERQITAAQFARLAAEGIAQAAALKQLQNQNRDVTSDLQRVRAEVRRAETEPPRAYDQVLPRLPGPVGQQTAMTQRTEYELQKFLRRENFQANLRGCGCLFFIALAVALFFLCSGLLSGL